MCGVVLVVGLVDPGVAAAVVFLGVGDHLFIDGALLHISEGVGAFRVGCGGVEAHFGGCEGACLFVGWFGREA